MNVTKVDKRELLSLENPMYKEVLAKYPHLRGCTSTMMTTKECCLSISCWEQTTLREYVLGSDHELAAVEIPYASVRWPHRDRRKEVET